MRRLSTAATSGLTGLPMAGKVARAQAIGPSRGGQTTKIHALTDILGRLGVLLLTPGNASDVTTAPAVLAEVPGRIRRLSADKGYHADWLRTDLRRNASQTVPGRTAEKSCFRRFGVIGRSCRLSVVQGRNRRPARARMPCWRMRRSTRPRLTKRPVHPPLSATRSEPTGRRDPHTGAAERDNHPAHHGPRAGAAARERSPHPQPSGMVPALRQPYPARGPRRGARATHLNRKQNFITTWDKLKYLSQLSAGLHWFMGNCKQFRKTVAPMTYFSKATIADSGS